MNAKYEITPTWRGETVLVLGNAPTLAAELAALVGAYGGGAYHAVAANQAVIVAPWADMAVSIDANWRPEANDYAGVRIIGFESDAHDEPYINFPHERVRLGEGHELHVRSNLLSAIRVAAAMGAARIIVMGTDPEYYEANLDAPGTAAGLAQVMAELNAQGVAIERVGPLPAEIAALDEVPAPAKTRTRRDV